MLARRVTDRHCLGRVHRRRPRTGDSGSVRPRPRGCSTASSDDRRAYGSSAAASRSGDQPAGLIIGHFGRLLSLAQLTAGSAPTLLIPRMCGEHLVHYPLLVHHEAPILEDDRQVRVPRSSGGRCRVAWQVNPGRGGRGHGVAVMPDRHLERCAASGVGACGHGQAGGVEVAVIAQLRSRDPQRGERPAVAARAARGRTGAAGARRRSSPVPPPLRRRHRSAANPKSGRN
jgi:hypothetical protein